jgi:hypothetical protein
MRSYVLIILSVLTLSLPVMSQTQTARVLGTVTDSTGGVIPAALVTVTNTGTNQSKTFTTDERGRFVFTDLQPGEYEISAEISGFKKYVGSGTTLRVNDSVEIPIRLEIGSPSETVNITASTPLLNTTTSALGEVVENKTIMELPLNGRQTLSLVMLVPGVVPNRQSDVSLLSQPFNRAGNFSIGGARGNTNELLLDGASNTITEGSTGAMMAVAVFPSVDATLEFKVQSNSYSAEYGRTGGGVVNIVTKSGSNELHGSVYEFLRNSVFDANNFFNNKNNIPRASFKRNQFGATVGGPIWIPGIYKGKNRSFFFFSYEGGRARPATTITDTVPTPQQISGDFSQTFNSAGKQVIIYDPATTKYDAATKTYTRTAFTGNVIPSTRINPIMKKVLGFYPTPLTAGDPYTHTNNLIVSRSTVIDENKFDIRIDHQLTSKQNFLFRFSDGHRDFIRPNVYGNVSDRNGAFPTSYKSIVLGDTYSISPKYLIDVKYSYNYLYFGQLSPTAGYDETELGFPKYLYDSSQTHEFPRFTYTGYGSMGFSSNTQWGKQEGHTLMSSLSRISSSHIIKVGSDIRMGRANRFANSSGSGRFVYDRTFTQGPNALTASTSAGDAIATALLGGANNSSYLNIAANPATQNWYNGFYFQDDWKISNKLTVNLGLRYDLEWPQTERFNHMSWFDSSVPSPIAAQVPSLNLRGAVTFAENSGWRNWWKVDRNNFAPRLGLAYQVTESTVIRTGYGIFYSPNPYGLSDTIGSGFSQQTPYVGTIDGATYVGNLADPYPNRFVPVQGAKGGPVTNLGLGMSLYNRGTVSPYIQQWNLDIQRKLTSTLVIDVAYSGAKGTKLTDTSLPLNQLTAAQLGPDVTATVANPFYGIITTGTLAATTVQKGQLLKAYPQYTSASLNWSSGASSIYHALQVKLTKRFSKGFSFLTSYTKGKLIDDNSGISSWLEPAIGHQDFYNRRADRAISDQDVAQRFVTSFNYAIPLGRTAKFGSNWSPAVDAILGGWQVNGILTLMSGIPVTLSTTNTSQSGSSLLRPNNNGGSAKLDSPSIDKWFNTVVFSQPANYTFGNVGRSLPDVRGCASKNFDFSLFKNVRLAESRYIQFRTEVFNVTNTPVFDQPDSNLQSGTFGRPLTQFNTPRQIQFGLKIIF